MQPIICPQCQAEVIPHETHRQRFEDCVAMFLDNAKYPLDLFPVDLKMRMAMNFFNELNDFIISDNIQKGKMETTAKIQSYKKANIQAINK